MDSACIVKNSGIYTGNNDKHLVWSICLCICLFSIWHYQMRYWVPSMICSIYSITLLNQTRHVPLHGY